MTRAARILLAQYDLLVVHAVFSTGSRISGSHLEARHA
jgi:hypothetical protein